MSFHCLKNKSVLTTKEQSELKDIIGKVASAIPGAVSAFDKYGVALDINVMKARNFLDVQVSVMKILNKAAIKQTLAHLPHDCTLEINAANTVYIDYDVLELIKDFINYGSKGKNIKVILRNFKDAYKMEDATHVHSD